MQRYGKTSKEACQNSKTFVKTEKSEFLGLFLPFFLPFFAMFSLLWLLVFLRLRHFLEEIFTWAYSLEFRKLAVERRDGIEYGHATASVVCQGLY